MPPTLPPIIEEMLYLMGLQAIFALVRAPSIAFFDAIKNFKVSPKTLVKSRLSEVLKIH